MRLDLHGFTESEALLKLDAILWEFEESHHSTLEIITGKGIVLQGLVEDELRKRKLNWEHPFGNTGKFIIYNS